MMFIMLIMLLMLNCTALRCTADALDFQSLSLCRYSGVATPCSGDGFTDAAMVFVASPAQAQAALNGLEYKVGGPQVGMRVQQSAGLSYYSPTCVVHYDHTIIIIIIIIIITN